MTRRELRLLSVPYHLGRERTGMGAGPGRFLDAGVSTRARGHGLDVRLGETRPSEVVDHETGATFAVLRSHADEVRAAIDTGAVPLTLGGNCNTAVATVAGVGGSDRLGIAWFDAHGDVNTPETTTSGFLDGMALATVIGRCWRSLAAAVPGFSPVPEQQVLLAAGRAFDAHEQDLLQRSPITVVPASEMLTTDAVADRFAAAVDALAARVDRLYIHLDLDAIDPSDGRANGFAAPGGPTLDALEACLDLLTSRIPLVAASLTSYDPAHDVDGRALRSGLRLLDHLFAAVAA